MIYVDAEQIIRAVQDGGTIIVEYQSNDFPVSFIDKIVTDTIEQCKECFIGLVKETDGVDLIRCGECRYAVPLDKHADVWGQDLKHCSMWRGEEERNVWHKYKKYYKDYSLVLDDGFCDKGERRE